MISIAITVTAVVGWWRTREHAPPPAPRDELRTALQHFRAEISAARTPAARRALAQTIVEVSDLQDASFSAHGDVYHHYVQPEPSSECLATGSCFADNLAFLRAAARAASTPRADVAVRAERLAAELTIEQIDAALAERIAYVAKRAEELNLPERGADKPIRTVTIIRTGHSSEARRDASLARLLAAAPIRVRELSRTQHPAIVDALGKRLTSAVLVDGKLYLDVVDDEQWIELLSLDLPLLPLTRAHADLPLFDAHEHIGKDGAGRLRGFVVDAKLAGALIAALPDGVDATAITASNDRVLAAASAAGAPLLPLVTLDVRREAPDLLTAMTAHLSAGARGLKLITGHDDYHRALGSPAIDPAPLRAVFAELEKRGVPLLWHVNTHLYEQGFLRVLRDFPRLTVVNPHLAGYLAYAPGIVRELLERYPNLHVDISFGTQPEYLRRSVEELSARRDQWRALFIDHSDRFMFGVDMVVTSTTSRAHARMLYRLYTSLLAAERYDLHYYRASGASSLAHDSHHHDGLSGLALPREVLRKVYFDNAARIYGAHLP